MKIKIIAAALAAVSPVALAGLPAGLSGSFYQKSNTGHGVHLEMTSPDSAVGVWNVFDIQGNPLTLYFEGTVQEDRIVAQVYAPRGMKFGSFDRSNFSAPRWGTLTLDFADCDHVAMTYDGNGVAGAGYGQGTLALDRLTRIAGLTCNFSSELTQVPAGAYEGDWGWPHPAWTGNEFRLHAAVDSDGRLWATSAWTPGVTYVSAVGYPPLLISSAPAATPNGLEAAMTARYNIGATRNYPAPTGPGLTTVEFSSDAGGTVTAASNGVPGMFTDLAVSRAPGANVLDDPGFDVDSLDGRRFTFLARGQFFDFTRTIEFGGNYANAGADHICIVHETVAAACEFEGRITAKDDGYAMFDFFLNHSFDPGRVYRGKGWVRSDTGELVMVAEGADRGLGLVALPKN